MPNDKVMNAMPFLRICVLLLFAATSAVAQSDSNQIKMQLRSEIDILAAPYMEGRGYVDKGLRKAAAEIELQFKKLDMEPGPGMATYRQEFNYSVNTFPGAMEVVLNGVKLVPGRDFLVDAASAPFTATAMPVQEKDLGTIGDRKEWKKVRSSLEQGSVWLLRHTDSFCRMMDVSPRKLPGLLKRGCYIVPVSAKQSWTVSHDMGHSTVIYVYDSVLPANITTADINIDAEVDARFKAENIIAKIPGMVKDTYIVFSAHYDHLGRMGPAVFPGASDNASGVAMLIYLASYFATHPQKYTMVFMVFSGEEAGLLGSKHFVNRPVFRPERIRFLTNIDIMGDATGGITVVNATLFPKQFAKLTAINDAKKYLPEIRSRGKAANSDHYPFSEIGVPAIFMYSIGGKGYYHDIYDRPSELSLANVPGVAHLLIDFVGEL